MNEFAGQLEDLIDKHVAAGGGKNEVVDALEIKLAALKEEEDDENDENDEAEGDAEVEKAD